LTIADRPWVIGLLATPSGVFSGFITVAMPFLLRRSGLSVDRIAEVSAIAALPLVWYFVSAPLVDFGLRRRTWIVVSTAAAALVLLVALQFIHSVPVFTILIVTGFVLSLLSDSAVGALMSGLEPKFRGAAAGWRQAGNIGAGSIVGGFTVGLAGSLNEMQLGFATALMLFLPSLLALLIDEPRPPDCHLRAKFTIAGHDLAALLKSKRTWTGLLFFLCPAGSGAAMNLFSSLGPDYHASNTEVMWITGMFGGLLCAAGSLIGGWIAGRMRRAYAYAFTGGLCALSCCIMILGPATSTVYALGCSAYLITTGIVYAVYTALILDVLGRDRVIAGTGYTMLNSSGNVPVSYMTWADGVGYKHFGRVGLMGVDAALGGLASLMLLLCARLFADRVFRSAPSTALRIEVHPPAHHPTAPDSPEPPPDKHPSAEPL
jgi:PAT family beta-lactamase induction signal transducer AmpG